MKNKKLKLAAVALLSMITLAGCSGGKDIVTMKGGKITDTQFFDELKKSSTSSETLVNMIIQKITLDDYGSKVDQKEIDKQYSTYEKQNGGKKSFEALLKQNNMTAKQFKDNIKQSLAFQEMLKSHIKVTDADLKETWKTYHPQVETQIMSFDSKENAEKALKKVNDGDDFDKVAKSDSQDTVTKEDGGKVKFDSTATTDPAGVTVPTEVKEAAYKLEDGKVSDLITVQNQQTGTDVYYIVKMVKNKQKGNDYKPYEKELKDIFEQTKISDPTFQQEVIGKELEKANVNIKDNQYKNILTPYLPQKETKTSDSKISDSKTSKSSDSKTSKSSDSKSTESSKEETTESTK